MSLSRPISVCWPLSAGRFRASGPMLAGAEMDFGPTALLGIGGVRIAVGSRAIQTMDQSMFRHLGVEPCEQRIIALKSSVHFRNDFQHFATAVLSVIAPGPVTVDLSKVAFSDSRLLRLAQKGGETNICELTFHACKRLVEAVPAVGAA